MPRYDDRHSGSRLYVGHLSSRTRSRDLEDMFSRYGRIRDVDMKRDYAFVEFSDPRDADDARYALNGRDLEGSRIIVEFAKGVPRGPSGSRDYPGRGPTPGSGRCFNCGLDGHWARDCKAGDWKNKCYRCGERGHIERNCQNSPKKQSSRPRSYSRSPSPRPRRGRSRSRSYSGGHSDSRSRSPVKRERSFERDDRTSRSPKRHRGSPPQSRGRKYSPAPDERSPQERGSPSPRDRSFKRDDRTSRSPKRHRGSSSQSRGRKYSPAPDERSPQERGSPSPRDHRHTNGSDYSASPRKSSRTPDREADIEGAYRSPVKENGHSRSPSPLPRDDRSPIYDDDDNHASPRRSESN